MESFGSLDGVIKEVHLRCLDESNGEIKKGLALCLEQGKVQEKNARARHEKSAGRILLDQVLVRAPY